MLVLEESYRYYKSKGEEKKEYLFTGRDVSLPKEERCSSNLFFEPTAEELDKYKNKLTDQTVEVIIKSLSVDFGGNVRLKGSLVVPPSVVDPALGAKK
jgi:hypothetical protein